MQTSSKGKKGIVLLPHLERPEHNSPSSEELWSRVVHPGAQGMTCAGPAEPRAVPGTQGLWECTGWRSTRDRCHRKMVIWTQTLQQNNWANYSTKTHVLQVQWTAKSPSEEQMHFAEERVTKITSHHKSYTVCSPGEWETPNWKPKDFPPCFKSCFPTETTIFEGRGYLPGKHSFWMRLIFLWG